MSRETEYIDVLIGDDSGGGGFHRRDAHADVHRILRTRPECLELSLRRTRRECKSTRGVFSGTASSAVPLRALPNSVTLCHLRNTRVRSEGDWRAGRESALVRTVRSRRSTERPLVARRSLGCRRPAQTAKRQLMAPTGGGTPQAKSENLSKQSSKILSVSEKFATACAHHIAWRRRIPMPASPRHRRAVTATKYEPPFYCLVRLIIGGLRLLDEIAHHPRARSELLAVVPLQRAALTLWFSGAISAAAAKLYFSLCSTGIYYRSRTGHVLPQPVESSPLASDSSLVLQLCHCSIGFLHAGRMTFANLRTPTRLVTTLDSVL